MSIMDIFRGKPAETAGTQAPGTQQGPAFQQQPNPGVNSVENPNGVPQNKPNEPENPLDSFKDLWAAPKEGDPKPETFDPNKLFNMDPAKVSEQVSKLNFTQSIPRELMAKVAAGGEEATQAMLAIVNQSTQQAFMQSMMVSSEMIKGAMGQANNHLDTRIEQRAKQLQAASQLREKHPILSNPAVAPMISAMEAQFATKYPNATAAELSKMAEDYVTKFAGAVSGSSNSQEENGQAGKGGDGATNWLEYAGINPSQT